MTAILSFSAPREAETALLALGHRVLRLPPHPSLPVPIASHPDMLLFFSPDAIFCTKSYLSLAKDVLETISERVQKPIRTVAEEYGPDYPHDVLLNAMAVSQRLFYLPGATAKELTEHQQCIPVRQGYVKCSTLPVTNNALITADTSIAKAARKEMVKVLEIRPGHILLAGYNYGFIGGCSSYAPYEEQETILFCGNLEVHPDAKEIRSFCIQERKRVLSLGQFPLTDVGTIFLI